MNAVWTVGLSAWKNVLADGGFWEAMLFTLQTTAMATFLALVIAVPLGIALRHSGRVAQALMIVLLPVPHLVVASTTVSWLGPGQLLDRLLLLTFIGCAYCDDLGYQAEMDASN